MADQILLGTRKGLVTLARRGRQRAHWVVERVAFLGTSVPMVLSDPRDGSVYVALGHGHFGLKMHRSADGGLTWEECGVPTYPPAPEGVEPVKCPVRNIPIPWNLEMIWCIESAGPDRPGGLWCGTIPGGLFRSNDRGTSWELVRSLWDKPERAQWFGGGYDYPGIHSVCVDPRDSRRVAVAVSCGGVWKTADAGETWTCHADGMRATYMPPEQANNPNIQDPHRMVRCPSRPDALWVQHHNGVFRTIDDCQSWHEISGISPSTFGFAVAVHPADADTAWLVPARSDEQRVPVDTKIVVTRTRDGGQNWVALADGLPKAEAFDLVYRHGLDVDSSGDRLIMGSTTGSVWVSENQGDSWKLISSHLPPVYCARFVPAGA